MRNPDPDRLLNLFCPVCGRETVTTYRSKKGTLCPICHVPLKLLQLPACVARRRIAAAETKRAARCWNTEAAKENSHLQDTTNKRRMSKNEGN